MQTVEKRACGMWAWVRATRIDESNERKKEKATSKKMKSVCPIKNRNRDDGWTNSRKAFEMCLFDCDANKRSKRRVYGWTVTAKQTGNMMLAVVRVIAKAGAITIIVRLTNQKVAFKSEHGPTRCELPWFSNAAWNLSELEPAFGWGSRTVQ